jgi:hypothetical protein
MVGGQSHVLVRKSEVIAHLQQDHVGAGDGRRQPTTFMREYCQKQLAFLAFQRDIW